MQTADRSLWSAWRARRDEGAFETLVRPHLAFANDLARRGGCSAAEADDVLQDALVRLAREDGDRPVEVGLRAWLGRVVSLRSKMLRREESRRRRREVASEVGAERPLEAPPGASEAARGVERALADLDERRREAVVLHHLHDMPYAEMARVLDVSEAACRLRVHRGIDDLRRRLGARAPALVAALSPFPLSARPEALVHAAVVQAASAAPLVPLVALGGLAMANKVLLASAAVVVASAGAFLALRPADSSPAGPAPADAPPVAAAPDAALRPREVAHAGEPRPAPDAAPVAAPPASHAEASTALVAKILASGGRVGLRRDPKDVPAGGTDVEWLGTGTVPEGRVVIAVASGSAGAETWLPDLAAFPDLATLDLTASRAVVDLSLLPVLPHLVLLTLPRLGEGVAALDALSRQPRLAEVELSKGRFDEASMRAVASLPGLRNLSFRGTPVTDAALAAIGSSTRIERLRLDETHVTDAGLEHVGRMTALTELDLSETRVSGRGLAHLAGIPGLRRLVLEKSRVTDDGLADVASLRALEKLDLEATGVGDAGVAHLAKAPALVEVNLKETRVTDASLDVLARIPTLKKVELGKSDVTKEGVARFRAARPDVKVRGMRD